MTFTARSVDADEDPRVFRWMMVINDNASPRWVPGWALARIFLAMVACVVSARATTVVPPTFDALVNQSDYIVRAVVKNVSAEKRAGTRGMKIVTRVELDVLEVVAGDPPADVTLEFLGGTVGDETLSVRGMPQFRAGDEDILFVSGNGRTICPLYGMMHGRYAIERDAVSGRKYVVRSDGMPLRDTAQIASPLAERALSKAAYQLAAAAALEPAEFIRRIRATKTKASDARTK